MLSLEKNDGKRLFISPDAILILEEDKEGSAIWYQFTDQILAAALKTSFRDVAALIASAPQGQSLITLTRADPVLPVRLPAFAISALNEIAMGGADGEVNVTQVAVNLGKRQFIYEVKEAAEAIMAAIEDRKVALSSPPAGAPISPPAVPASRPSRKRPPAKRG